MIREDDGFGHKQVTRYISNEDPNVVIEIVRGALRHDRPTGFTLKYKGRSDFSGRINSFLTLSEAKEWAKFYAKNGWR